MQSLSAALKIHFDFNGIINPEEEVRKELERITPVSEAQTWLPRPLLELARIWAEGRDLEEQQHQHKQAQHALRLSQWIRMFRSESSNVQRQESGTFGSSPSFSDPSMDVGKDRESWKKEGAVSLFSYLSEEEILARETQKQSERSTAVLFQAVQEQQTYQQQH
jgi:hypothetical protein